ncbi:MAG TPA: Rrf2 family transcriptional regulator [Parvularcula sp.]|nr:Rrf2 family transcriptional regulator [Parvularcula sp.]HBS35727.1 Rrf2 family transcriptional regulator [Parvularcula sp.]
MRLTTKGRYAVQAMADIAAFGEKGPLSLSAIAERQGLSAAYLEQLFLKLRRAGLVDSARGADGGYRLARGADAISVSAIVEAVDEEIRTTACGGAETGCRGDGARCLTHDLWEALGGHIEAFLSSVTLDDIVTGRIPSSRKTPAPPQPEERSGARGGAPWAPRNEARIARRAAER